MAHPIGFRQANSILKKPDGMEDCSDLEVFRDGTHVISRWQFTDEELEELKRNGGKCFVWIWGRTQPPISITPLSPFEPPKGNAPISMGKDPT